MISFINRDREPQENQYQGDTPSKPDNSTSWMAPSTPESSYKDTGAQNPQNQTPSAPSASGGSSDGTALSSAINGSWYSPASGTGNTGINGGASWQESNLGSQPNNQQAPTGRVGQYMPEGYDTGKFSDTANANSTKYQVGRILSQYPPGPEGLQQAAGELARLGITVSGRDKITLPDGTTTDVGKSFSDPNAQHAWQYNWSGPLDAGTQERVDATQSVLGQVGGNQQGSNQQGNFQGGMNSKDILMLLQNQQQQPMRIQPRPYDFGTTQYGSEGPGGITGNAQDPNFGQLGTMGMPPGSMGIGSNRFMNNGRF